MEVGCVLQMAKSEAFLTDQKTQLDFQPAYYISLKHQEKSGSHCNIKGAKKIKAVLYFFCKEIFKKAFLLMVQLFCPQEMSAAQSISCLGCHLDNQCIPRSSRTCQMCSSQGMLRSLGGLETQPPWSLFFSSETYSFYFNALISFYQQVLIKPLSSTKHSYRY